jgi:ABC-2 type transport system ATP-binding protein
MKTALTVENLSFAYGRKHALKEVSFELNKGECTLLLGPNGAGKSTLFSLITRLYDSHHGRIHLCGFDIKKQSRQALGQLGIVYQQTTLDLDLTVLQNLRYHLALQGINRKIGAKRIQEELERLHMYERRYETIRQLNSGHRRRVEIARALLHRPSLLLLDEPTVGLDVPSRKSIVEHIHQLAENRGLSVLWASHLIDEIYPNDRLLILHQGQIKARGSINQVLLQTASNTIDCAFNQLTQGALK